MKKIISFVGAATMVAALSVPALAANGISTINDDSMAHITTKKVMNMVNNTITSIGVNNAYQGTNTIASSHNSGGNYLSAKSDVTKSKIMAGEVGAAVEVDTTANTTGIDTATSSEQISAPVAEEDAIIENIDDGSMAHIDTVNKTEKYSDSITMDSVNQAAIQDNVAAVETNSGDNGASGDDVEEVEVVSGANVAAFQFKSMFNMASLKKVFTYKQ